MKIQKEIRVQIHRNPRPQFIQRHKKSRMMNQGGAVHYSIVMIQNQAAISQLWIYSVQFCPISLLSISESDLLSLVSQSDLVFQAFDSVLYYKYTFFLLAVNSNGSITAVSTNLCRKQQPQGHAKDQNPRFMLQAYHGYVRIMEIN